MPGLAAPAADVDLDALFADDDMKVDEASLCVESSRAVFDRAAT